MTAESESDQLVTALASLRDVATGLDSASGTFTKRDDYDFARRLRGTAACAREAAALLEKILTADAKRAAARAASAALKPQPKE